MTFPVMPRSGIAQLRIFNGDPACEYHFQTNLHNAEHFAVSDMGYFERKLIHVPDGDIRFEFDVIGSGVDCRNIPGASFIMQDSSAYSLFLQPKAEQPLYWYKDSVAKSKNAYPLVRTLVNIDRDYEVIWRDTGSRAVQYGPTNQTHRDLLEVRHAHYNVYLDQRLVHSEKLKLGGVYTLLIADGNATQTRLVAVTPANSISMLWQIPQYVVLSMAEVMFSVTGVEFSYAQAPFAMKTLFQAIWLLTMGFGNLIIVFVAQLTVFESRASELFLYAGIMFADMMIFMWLADNYEMHDPYLDDSGNNTNSVCPMAKRQAVIRRRTVPQYICTVDEY